MTLLVPHVNAHSVGLVVLHAVWATLQRQPMIEPDLEPALFRCLRAKSVELESTLIAAGAADDHVHVLLQVPPTLAATALIARLKGASSHDFGRRLRWQAGYWVESISPQHLGGVLDYVTRQRAHHAAHPFDEAWSRREPWSPPAGAA